MKTPQDIDAVLSNILMEGARQSRFSEEDRICLDRIIRLALTGGGVFLARDSIDERIKYMLCNVSSADALKLLERVALRVSKGG